MMSMVLPITLKSGGFNINFVTGIFEA